MAVIDEAIKEMLRYMSTTEKTKLKQTLDDISRNTMIRKEVMHKRDEGKTVKAACRELSEDVNLDAEYIEKLYYQR
jgi:hypothetical protein